MITVGNRLRNRLRYRNRQSQHNYILNKSYKMVTYDR